MSDNRQSPLLTHWHRVLHERGDSIAVIDFANGGSRHTFAEIEAEALRIGQELASLQGGNQHEGEVPTATLLTLPNGARWLSAYLAILRSNSTILPLEPGQHLPAVHTVNITAGIDTKGIHAIKRAATTEPLLRTDTTANALPKMLLRPDASIADLPETLLRPAAIAAADTAATHLIKLTSGSTGQPQALRFTEANMIADGLNIIASMGLRADSINFATIPFGHSYGLGNLVLPFFLQGSAIVCASSILPRIAAAEIAASSATFFPAVPTLLRAFCIAGIEAGELSTLETVISAGSILSPETAREFYALSGKRVHNFYGSSETGGICFDADGEATLNGGSIGTPLANVQVDTDEQGRVRVQSEAVCPDLADPQQRVTLEDRATVLASCQVRLEGRGGRMLKIGARRLDMSVWETQARALAGIEDAFTCAGTRPGGEAMLCAAIQTQLSLQAVREQLATAFPRWQQPSKLLTFDAFPQTARGKTDTSALRTLLAAENSQPR